MNLARLQFGAGCLFAACIALSTIHPWGNPRSNTHPDSTLLEGSSVPESIRTLLGAKCGDCHSQSTHYPLYAHLAPVSWMMEHDIHEARSHLDMSRWQSMNNESRISVLTRMASVAHAGQMPPRAYVMLHPGARLSPQEQQQIYEWARSERKRLREERTRFAGQPEQSGTEKP